MLHITEWQAARFADKELEAFVNELIIHQYKSWKECRGYSIQEITSMVEGSVKIAPIHGFSSRYEISSFVDFSIFVKELKDLDYDKITKILLEPEKKAISKINAADHYIENMDEK